jgi:spore germination cell wall hydrolase CwlJ-like protein
LLDNIRRRNGALEIEVAMLVAVLRVPFLRAAMLERESLWPDLRLRAPALRREHWLASFALALLIGFYLFAGFNPTGAPDGRAAARTPANLSDAVKGVPAPEPLKFVEIAPQDAVALNAAVPVSTLPNPAARPFVLRAASSADRERALQCLTQAVYYEAAIEPLDGQRAVAQVVLNRVRHPAYPNSVCGVVYQGAERSTGCQFTFTCDGSLARTPNAGLWRQARQIAEAALAGKVFKPVGWATHYHTNWVVPYWSSSLVKAALVGTHIFYRWTGGWGTGPAFTSRYAGIEPDAAARMAAAKTVDGAAAAAAVLASLTPEQIAAADKEGKLPVAGSVDSFQRAVLRRYEPMPGAALTALLASQAGSGEGAASASARWALAGEAAATKVAPLGSKATPPLSKPVAPLGANAAPLGKKAETAAAEQPKAAAPAETYGPVAN